MLGEILKNGVFFYIFWFDFEIANILEFQFFFKFKKCLYSKLCSLFLENDHAVKLWTILEDMNSFMKLLYNFLKMWIFVFYEQKFEKQFFSKFWKKSASIFEK